MKCDGVCEFQSKILFIMSSSLPTIKFVSAMSTFPKPVLSGALLTSLCPGGKRRLWVPWGGFLCSLSISGRGRSEVVLCAVGALRKLSCPSALLPRHLSLPPLSPRLKWMSRDGTLTFSSLSLTRAGRKKISPLQCPPSAGTKGSAVIALRRSRSSRSRTWMAWVGVGGGPFRLPPSPG